MLFEKLLNFKSNQSCNQDICKEKSFGILIYMPVTFATIAFTGSTLWGEDV
jgi:hypothetical protein